MAIRIVVGTNWGDEGKGRMVDYLAREADIVIRFQGGSNAGHSIENRFGKFKLHLVPSGIFYENVVNILGPGTVINLEAAVKELTDLRAQGIRIDSENYKISDRATICFPFHLLQDEYEEARLAKNMFGSTKQGIAPVYGDRYMKNGIQVGALLYPDYLKQEIDRCLNLKNRIFETVYHQPPVSSKEIFFWATEYGELLKPHICDSVTLLKNAIRNNKRILLEGQLGALRDIYYGIYPFTTSSSTVAGFGLVGAGCFCPEVPVVTGVMKAFSTCVGEGPFVTELHDELASRIRETSFEYGASTGRPRRIGWFDAVASRYGAYISSANEIALTKLDALTGIDPIRICTAYRVGSRIIDCFPIMPELSIAEPVYTEVPGWLEEITGVRNFNKLPGNAIDYINRIEKLVECPVKYISVGPSREAIILR
jgi:adenylosuccinate synthase